MAPARDTVAPRTSHSPFLQACLKHQEGFSNIGTDYLAKAGNYLAIGGQLGRLEQQGSAVVFVGGGFAGGGEKVVDAIVVNFVHGYNDGVLGGGIAGHYKVADVRRIGKRVEQG